MKRKIPESVIMLSALLCLISCNPSGNLSKKPDGNVIAVNHTGMRQIGRVDERFQSFNVEMAEVVGGNFWIPYDKMDTTQNVTLDENAGIGANKNLFRAVPPINLYEKRLCILASALAPSYLRVSGTWANTTWFQDNDGPKLTTAPDGFKNVLSRKEWKGVVDFTRTINARLVTSFAISDGVRNKEGIWTPDQAKSLVNYTRSVGGEIAAAELFNEPTYAGMGGAPAGYNATFFAKDIAVFRNFIHSTAPDMIVLGPGSVGEGGVLPVGGINKLATDDLLSANPKPDFDVFTYHFYGAVSKRCMPSGPGSISPDQALSQGWLNKTETAFNYYKVLRDKYLPGTPIWLTETADAACGGNPWATTFLDCFRYLEQSGRLAKCGVQVVMHNTLAASEYGLLDQDTHLPRPNYWAALLWNRFMGTEVFDAGSVKPGVDIFAHSLKNKPGGIALMIVNTLNSDCNISIPSKSEEYVLTAIELQAKKVQLNGKDLELTANDELPVIEGKTIKPGTILLPPYSITFLTFNSIKL